MSSKPIGPTCDRAVIPCRAKQSVVDSAFEDTINFAAKHASFLSASFRYETDTAPPLSSLLIIMRMAVSAVAGE